MNFWFQLKGANLWNKFGDEVKKWWTLAHQYGAKPELIVFSVKEARRWEVKPHQVLGFLEFGYQIDELDDVLSKLKGDPQQKWRGWMETRGYGPLAGLENVKDYQNKVISKI